MNRFVSPLACAFLCLILLQLGCNTLDTQQPQNPLRVVKEAFPFGPPEDQRAYAYRRLRGLDTDGQHVFLSSNESGLIELDGDGRLVQTFAVPGAGPAFAHMTLAAAITDDLVWVLDLKRQLLCFERQTGAFLYRLRLDISPSRFNALLVRGAGSKSLIAVDRTLLLPIGLSEDPKNIATLFDDQGNVVKHIFDPDYVDRHQTGQAQWNRTLWLHNNGFWYCAYMHGHRILKFDEHFNKHLDVPITTPKTQVYDTLATTRTDHETMVPFFWDMDHFGEALYLQHQEGIVQINKNNGAFVKTLDYRYNMDRKIGDEWSYGAVGFSSLAILDNGQVILAPFFPEEIRDDLFQATVLDD